MHGTTPSSLSREGTIKICLEMFHLAGKKSVSLKWVQMPFKRLYFNWTRINLEYLEITK